MLSAWMELALFSAGCLLAIVLASVLMVRGRRRRKALHAETRRQAARDKRERSRAKRAARFQETMAAFHHPKPGTERRPVVLVVDDSETTRTALRTLLEENSYRVVLAENGRKAWQILQDQRPDLVISDIDMPQLNGMQLVQMIREDLSLADIPVILMTSYLAYDVQVGTRTGISGFLPKPYQPADVLQQIRYLLAE